MKPKTILLVILFSFLLPTASFAFEGPDAFDKAAYLRQWTETLQKGDSRTKILVLNDPPGLLKCNRDKTDLHAFNPIFNALKDKNPAVREAAVTALKRIADWPKGICAGSDISLVLIKALKDDSPQVRKEAAAALAYYQDTRAITPLIKSLKDRDPWVRLNATFALGELGDAEAVQPLLELLDDNADWRNKYVQQECLIAIRKIANKLPYFHKQKQVVPVLVEKFDDEYLKAEIIKMLKDVKLCAPYITNEMIRASQNPKGNKKLRQKLSDEMKWQDFCVLQFKEKIIIATKDPNEKIRRLALEALEKPIFGGTRKIEKQGHIIEVKHPALAASLNLAKDPSAEVRAKAIESLGKLCPLSDPTDPSREAVRGRIIEALADALHDSDTNVREKAIEALGSTRDARAIKPLVGLLNDNNVGIQHKAVEALGKFEDERILDELIPLLALNDYSLQEAVKESFFAITARSCQERVYVYQQDGVRYCVKSRNEIPKEVRISENNIRLVHPNAVAKLINGLKDPNSDVKLGIFSVIWKFEDVRIKQTLTKLLDDPSPYVKLKAYSLLRDLGEEPDIDLVITCLKDKDINVKLKAAAALGDIKNKRAVQPLIAELNDPNAGVRETVVRALGKLNDTSAIEPLIQRVSDDNYRVRQAVLNALANFDDSRIIDAHISMLQDESPYVRRTATRNISQKPDKRAVEPLILLLNDPDSDVPSLAAEALGKTGDRRAVEPLIKALKGECNKKRGFRGDEKLRQKAALALGQIGDKRAVEPLISILMKGGFNKDRRLGRDAQVRRAAAIALGEIGDQRAVPVLIDALNDNQLRSSAIIALGGLKDNRSIPALLKAVGGEPPHYNQTVKEALEAYENPEMVDILVGYLDEKDKDIKKGAICMLGEFRDQKAIDPLQRLAHDADPQIRDAVKIALRKIQTEPYPPKAEGIRGVPDKITDSRGRRVIQQPRKIKDPQAVLPLIEKMKNPDDKVRRPAFNTLVHLDDQRIVDLVAPLLGDANKDIACDAAKLLGKTGDPRAVDPLSKALKGQYDRQDDFRDRLLKQAVISALVETGDPRGIDVLIDVVQGKFSHSSPTGRDIIQTQAILALGETGNTQAVPALIEALNDPHLRTHTTSTIRSLVIQRDNRAIPALLKRVGTHPDGSYYIQDVKGALVAYKDPRMGDIILGYLGDDNKETKIGAIIMLGESRNQKAIEPLQNLAQDPDPQIRDAAKNALQTIQAPPPKIIITE